MQSDAQRDARYQRLYGITLKDYERMLKEQKGVCAICGRPPKNRRLAVDHDHSLAYLKIETWRDRVTQHWTSRIIIGNLGFCFVRAKRNQAIQAARAFAKNKAVRGLLCWACNVGLRKWNDRADLLERAAQYLKKYGENECLKINLP